MKHDETDFCDFINFFVVCVQAQEEVKNSIFSLFFSLDPSGTSCCLVFGSEQSYVGFYVPIRDMLFTER